MNAISIQKRLMFLVVGSFLAVSYVAPADVAPVNSLKLPPDRASKKRPAAGSPAGSPARADHGDHEEGERPAVSARGERALSPLSWADLESPIFLPHFLSSIFYSDVYVNKFKRGLIGCSAEAYVHLYREVLTNPEFSGIYFINQSLDEKTNLQERTGLFLTGVIQLSGFVASRFAVESGDAGACTLSHPREHLLARTGEIECIQAGSDALIAGFMVTFLQDHQSRFLRVFPSVESFWSTIGLLDLDRVQAAILPAEGLLKKTPAERVADLINAYYFDRLVNVQRQYLEAFARFSCDEAHAAEHCMSNPIPNAVLIM